VIHTSYKVIFTLYDREIETNIIENIMTIKLAKVSFTAFMVAFSLFAFGTIVFG